jgi:hypothetical protein
LAVAVNEKGCSSFAAENVPGADEWPGRKVEQPRGELNRNETPVYVY